MDKYLVVKGITMCHSVLCLTPPHILEALAQRGNAHQKQFATSTLTHTQNLRSHRDSVAVFQNLALKEAGFKSRVIESARMGQDVTGRVVKREGDGPTGDKIVEKAYNFSGNVYDFYWSVFGRNSIDNKGGTLYSTVHFGKNFNNAFWNGERMVYGDGDGQIFKPFTNCLEIVGHELTHGITNATADLVYSGQSGALNESISDVFGCLVKQYTLNQKVRKADWIIGKGLFTKQVKGKGVRDLAEPGSAYNDTVLGKDPCPATMDDYVTTKQDNGGVHINCTIPSHAFYLGSIELGGYAWIKLGEVWYKTLLNKLDKNSNFVDFADSTLQVSRKINGQGSRITKALNRAWKKVKIL